ncbi:MAG: class II fructose-bisphosphate aldolase [Chryseolinea sp.]
MRSLFKQAKKERFALPAINVVNTNTINAVLETATEVNSPANHKHNASIKGAVAAAKYVHEVSDLYLYLTAIDSAITHFL